MWYLVDVLLAGRSDVVSGRCEVPAGKIQYWSDIVPAGMMADICV